MRTRLTVPVTLLLVLSLAACADLPLANAVPKTPEPSPSGSQPAPSPTPPRKTAEPVRSNTSAVETVASGSIAIPIPTTQQPPAVEEPAQPGQASSPAVPCERAAAGIPMDLTIPDNTVLQPGSPFTKTWRLVNTGSCAWTRDFGLVWFSGEQFSAVPSNRLPGVVAPGQAVDLTIDMIAPEQPGVYQSHWKLSSPSGRLFGIGPSGNAPIWVRIVVPVQDTPVPSDTPTPQPTQEVYRSGEANLIPGDDLDLDNNLTSSGANADLLYNTDPSGIFLLTPQNGGQLGSFNSVTPSLEECRAAEMSDSTAVLDGVQAGSTACVRTSLGLPGWIRLVQLDPVGGALTLELLIWTTP